MNALIGQLDGEQLPISEHTISAKPSIICPTVNVADDPDLQRPNGKRLE
jgi:hypothetical protein